jgi:4a-hydroxytetrahydrobiopterin dehydratase
MLAAMPKMSNEESRRRLSDLHGWELTGDAIHRQFTFNGFTEAIAFVVRLAFVAEAADHHPDIAVSYKRVTLSYSTHSEGGLTEKDFEGAAEVSKLAGTSAT